MKKFLLCFALFFTLPATGMALTLHSQDRAQQALDQAIDALGGIAKLKSLSSIVVEGAGREMRSAEAQGRHPDKQTNEPHNEKLAIDVAGARTAYEIRTRRHDGTWRWRRTIFLRDQRIVADFISKFATSRSDPGAVARQMEFRRRIPHLLLLEAAENRNNLRWLREEAHEGRKHDVVSFALPGGAPLVTIFFDSGTHLISKFGYETDFPALGNTGVSFVYRAYRRDTALGWFPTGHSIRVGSNVLLDTAYSRVATSSDETLLQLPEELRSYITPPGSVVEIAKGVYLVENLSSYNTMFIEFKDFVLAIEAPALHPSLEIVAPGGRPSGEISEMFLSKIRQKIPNKPVRYLVVTHYHSDHAGGAPVFMAAGTTLLTTPGNRRFFEKLTAGEDRAAIETFDRKRVITDGKRRVELINVGPNPHTDEMIVVYLPQENFIFQGDLFYYSDYESFPTRSRVTIMRFFARWLLSSGIAPKRIYSFHGTGFATMEQVRHIINFRQ